ncbi:MAG: hypothetical protein UZ17_ACD001000115 [Acidobacteria bacterium OLB17]|nr:MAG: hypothetical protein UZ17_ACD001000115 [Acidobacteria bacterium OLB17]MCZ2390307.1 carbohydrate binding domain-containing protein [Acidobacteriota bacterium]
MPTFRSRTDTTAAKAFLIAAVLLAAAAAWFGARWNFANSASMRADRTDMIPLLTRLGPDDPQTHFAAAVLLDKTFEPADAAASLAEFKRAAELSPNNYLVVLALAKAYDRAGDRDLANAEFERALALAPNYADVKFAYGNFLLRGNGREQEAFALISSAAQSRPEYASAAATLALETADQDIGKARLLLGDAPAARAALAVYLLTKGRIEDAAALWNGLPESLKTGELKPSGERLAAKLLEAKQYRLAVAVLNDLKVQPSLAVNTVTNGGFENGVSAAAGNVFNWTIANGREPQIALADKAHSGKVSLYFVFDSKRADAFRTVKQTVAVEPGSKYRLSAFYTSELRAAEDVSMHFVIEDAAGTALAAGPPLSLNADWAETAVEFTVPADLPDGIVIKLTRDDCHSPICPITGRLWLDDVTLTKK